MNGKVLEGNTDKEIKIKSNYKQENPISFPIFFPFLRF